MHVAVLKAKRIPTAFRGSVRVIDPPKASRLRRHPLAKGMAFDNAVLDQIFQECVASSRNPTQSKALTPISIREAIRVLK
jgi:hypothetical protein